MSIPSKGSRRIVVDDIAYLWRVRHKPSYCQGVFDAALTFAVQRESFGRCTLRVTLDRPRPDNWLQTPSAIVTPALVAQAIRQALGQGWQPSTAGSAFELRAAAPTFTSPSDGSIQTLSP